MHLYGDTLQITTLVNGVVVCFPIDISGIFRSMDNHNEKPIFPEIKLPGHRIDRLIKCYKALGSGLMRLCERDVPFVVPRAETGAEALLAAHMDDEIVPESYAEVSDQLRLPFVMNNSGHYVEDIGWR